MAEKITYILGAGASIGAYPLVKGTPEWTIDNKKLGLADVLFNEGEKLVFNFGSDAKIGSTASRIGNELQNIGKFGKEFGNIDTYAKYLYHSGEKRKLHNLKMALTYFFARKLICQGQQNNEKRYLNFITSLFTDRHCFPEHVNILSWNYDFLFEEAGSIFKSEQFHSHAISHLNGTSGVYGDIAESGEMRLLNIYENTLGKNMYDKIEEKSFLDIFHKKYIEEPNLITFAWEKESPARNILPNNFKPDGKILSATQILVVIGYSFPFYNREIDNAVFEMMKPTLRKIYFQDPNPNMDGEFLRKRYDLQKEGGPPKYMIVDGKSINLPNVVIENIKDKDQFYIPVEV